MRQLASARLLPLLVVCVLATATRAPAQSQARSEIPSQTVELRSGDHPGYARLVLDFPGPRPGWRLGRGGQGYILNLDIDDVTIDTRDVYRLIGPDRIAGVTQTEPGGPLAIVLGCDCHADAFDFGDASIVVDIRDGPPPPDSPFEALPDTHGDGRDQIRTALPDLASDLSAALVAGAVLPFEWQDGPGAELRARPDGPAIGPGPAARRPARPLSADDVLTVRQAGALATPVFPESEPDGRTVEAIARQLGRAASQGLVEAPAARPEPEDVQSPHVSAVPDTADTRSDTADTGSDTGPAAEPTGRGNIRILTGVDSDFAAAGLDRPVPQSDPFCLPDRAVAVGSWGDEARTGTEIAAYRAAILDGSDRPDDRAILALARHYVFLTFGAEVRALLDAFPGTLPDASILLALAEVMDRVAGDRPPMPEGPLVGQAGCASDVALWALLAAPDPAAETPATAAIVAAFSGLPLHLRRHVAPRLARAFELAGDADAARAVLFAVTRAPGDHGDAVALAAAMPDDAGALEALLNGDPPQAADAALTILERAIAAGGTVDDAAISTAAAFAFEFRDLPSGPPLKAAEIRGLIANAEVRQALVVLQRATSERRIDDAVAQTLAAELLLKAADGAGDVDFVTIAVALGPRIRPDASAGTTRITAAARLFDLGFDDLAENLARPADMDAPPLRLARTRRALALGNPTLALSWLAGLDDAEARLLEAEALSAAGRHRDAADAFGRLGDGERSEAEALRARDWARLTDPPGALPDPAGPGQVTRTDRGPGTSGAAAVPDRSPSDLLLQAEALREGFAGLLGRTSR